MTLLVHVVVAGAAAKVLLAVENLRTALVTVVVHHVHEDTVAGRRIGCPAAKDVREDRLAAAFSISLLLRILEHLELHGVIILTKNGVVSFQRLGLLFQSIPVDPDRLILLICSLVVVESLAEFALQTLTADDSLVTLSTAVVTMLVLEADLAS